MRRLADSAAATSGVSDIGSTRRHFLRGIGNCNRKTDAAEERQILNIIAYITDAVFGQLGLFKNLFKS